MRKGTVALVLAGTVAFAACEPEASPSAPHGLDLPVAAGKAPAGFRTPIAPQADLRVGGDLVALATVDDVMPGSGEQLAGTLDGIGIWGGQRYLNLMVNHEIGGASRVSRMTIDTRSLHILDHLYVLDGSEGYDRLCSAEWVDARDGFPGGYFFTGEEVTDGVQLAIDEQGRVTELPHIGLYNHENQMSIPGFPGHVVVLNTDDNGGSGVGRAGSRSELYMYVARNSEQVLEGAGQLYMFKADDTTLFPNDLTVGGSIQGHWIPVPADVATDVAGLEKFADDNLAFPFMRLEDLFYDKRPGAAPGAFIFDTGRGSIRDEDTNQPIDPWGSIYHIGFSDRKDPAGGSATLTLVARSQGPGSAAAPQWASPDNGDMSADGVIMLQEDPANGPWERGPAIFRLQLGSGLSVGPAQEIVRLPYTPGDLWESSGIVDASDWFGPGAWIFDIQAHSISSAVAGDGGQLLFMKLDD